MVQFVRCITADFCCLTATITHSVALSCVLDPYPLLMCRFSDVIRARLSDTSDEFDLDLLFARQLPMIAPPLPWSSHNRGGYYRNSSMWVRCLPQLKNSTQVWEQRHVA